MKTRKRKAIEYTVISCPGGQECSGINEHLANGWELHGPLIVRKWHKNENGFSEFFVWQAMVREIETESKQENSLVKKEKHKVSVCLWSDGVKTRFSDKNQG